MPNAHQFALSNAALHLQPLVITPGRAAAVPDSAPHQDAVAGAESAQLIAEELATLPPAQTVFSSGDYRVILLQRNRAPHAMREIGRLRELAFRAVGEGTGKSRDIDEFDDWYEQLLVWHSGQRQILGAYRLCRTDVVVRSRGIEGLYTRQLFEYEPSFLSRLGPAIELGRSFVAPVAQGTGRVLPLLWRGIAHVVAASPRYRTLFGPVSVSSRYTTASRRLIASELTRVGHRHGLSQCVRPLRPVVPCNETEPDHAMDAADLSRRIEALEPDRKGLPILVKEYIKLGGKFLGFSVDPLFSDALDGLVAVDLEQTCSRLLTLYMGPENYRRFRAGNPSLEPVGPLSAA